MSISVAVMAHPERAEMVEELVGWLQREPVDVTIVYDQISDRWDTGRRSMLAYDESASHHLVIQDDSIPCLDLIAGIETAVEHVPENSPLMLYVGRVRPYRKVIETAVARAERSGDPVSWLVMAETYWGPGLVFPTQIIEELVEFCDDRPEPNYDRRLGVWFREAQIPVYATWPSLVEHRDSPSLILGRTSRRFAHRFIGADISATSVDWSGASVEVRDPKGPLRQPAKSRQKPTPTRSFPARVGSPTRERHMDAPVVDRAAMIDRLSSLPDTDDAAPWDQIGRAIAAKWLLGSPDADPVDVAVGIAADMSAAISSSSVALEWFDAFPKIAETYTEPDPVPDAVIFECRPVRAPAAASGRRHNYRTQAIKYLRSRGGGWLTTKDRSTGLTISIERIDDHGAVIGHE